MVGNLGDAHVRGFVGVDAGKKIFDDETGSGRNVELLSGTEVDIEIRLAAFDFIAGDDELEERGELMSI